MEKSISSSFVSPKDTDVLLGSKYKSKFKTDNYFWQKLHLKFLIGL